MTMISRRQFRKIFEGGVDLRDARVGERLRREGIDIDTVVRADRDGDGKVRGFFELNALFAEVNRSDRNGWFLSVDGAGTAGRIVQAMQVGPARKARPLDDHIDLYQRVLRTHLAGAHLIDANDNGELDASDVVWTRDAAGQVNVRQLGQALCERVRIGAAMTSACEDMGRARHAFALLDDQSFSRTHWQQEGGGTFHVRDGVRPSQALRDVFAHPDAYRFECATALVLVHYKAMLELVGDDDFDRMCPRLRVGPWETDEAFVRHTRSEGDSAVEASEERRRHFRAGDYGYIKNWDVSEKGARAGWQGENVIALGDGRFYGHPFGVTTEDSIVQHLNTHRVEGAARPAGLLDLRMELGSSILDEDQSPG